MSEMKAQGTESATVAELFDGLSAASQNRWPSLDFDALAVNDLLSPIFAAGSHHETSMWPKSLLEQVHKPIIRRAAGLGRAIALLTATRSAL